MRADLLHHLADTMTHYIDTPRGRNYDQNVSIHCAMSYITEAVRDRPAMTSFELDIAHIFELDITHIKYIFGPRPGLHCGQPALLEAIRRIRAIANLAERIPIPRLGEAKQREPEPA